MNGIRLYPAGAYSLIAIALLILAIVIILPLLILGIAGAAFSRLGFSWTEAVAVLLLMTAGSFVNIPLHTFRRRGASHGNHRPVVFDAFSGEPVPDEGSFTTLTLNIGGAVIPAGICLFLLYQAVRLDPGPVAIPSAISFVTVTLITFYSTKILPGWGIRAPLFLPALGALACGILLSGGTGLYAGVTAVVGGTMGTLAGATACGLVKGIREGISTISIGGSGMFGSIILCALLAALAA